MKINLFLISSIILLIFSVNKAMCQEDWQDPGNGWITIDSITNPNIGPEPDYFDISCHDSMNCAAMAGDTRFVPGQRLSIIRKTTDGGNNWTTIKYDDYPPLIPNRKFISYPYDDCIIVVCDSGLVLRTSDAGDSWEQHWLDVPNEHYQATIFQMKGDFGVIYYAGEGLYRTTDGGEHWEKWNIITDPQIQLVTGFNIINDKSLYIHGYDFTKADSLYHYFYSSNRGKIWQHHMTRERGNVVGSGAYYINKKIGWSSRDLFVENDTTGDSMEVQTIRKTTDGGKNWNIQYIDTNKFAYLVTIGKLQFIDSLNGIGTSMKFVYHTTDGGKNWNKIKPFENSKKIHFIYNEGFFNAEHPVYTYGPKIIKYVGTTDINTKKEKQNLNIKVIPNPIRSDKASIKFNIPYSSKTAIKIMDIYGREVLNLAQNKYFSAGINRIEFDPSKLNSGIYFVVLKTPKHREIIKFINYN